ncbi:hypothetical protein KC19_9G035200 [Ceratodon purpureus]|uniref:Uncharacterized protein n=1 Tax=Ceratodon purpureus TaxID=3225 RepID=A0A8T0GNE4_CERPU|nr:hypothetical protein KC19_9G035200 [Ceratodon purpureus]
MAPAEKFSCKSKREGDACVSKLVVISEVGEARGKPTVQAAIERMNRAKILNGGGRLPQKRGYVSLNLIFYLEEVMLLKTKCVNVELKYGSCWSCATGEEKNLRRCQGLPRNMCDDFEGTHVLPLGGGMRGVCSLPR